MASRSYNYFPLTGALPGLSFEKQTVSFLEGLQEQIDALTNQMSILERDTNANIGFIRDEVEDVLKGAVTLRDEVAAAVGKAEQAMNKAKEALDYAHGLDNNASTALILASNANTLATEANKNADIAMRSTVPESGIMLMHGPVPKGWSLADGKNGTIDLSHYTNHDDLVYVEHIDSAEEPEEDGGGEIPPEPEPLPPTELTIKYVGDKTFGTIDEEEIIAKLAKETATAGDCYEVTDTNSFWQYNGEDWTNLGYIYGKVYNSIPQSGADLLTCDGRQRGKSWIYKNCIFDARSIPLDSQDEAISVVWGATARLENCLILNAKKAILCGTGDSGDWGGRLTMENCLIINAGRRCPEAQQGYQVNMYNCWIHNWGIEETFDVRAFAAWAHDDATINIKDCIFTRNSGLGSNDATDIANWVGWYTNEFGAIPAIGKKRYGQSGSLRAIEDIGGGNIGSVHCYRNQSDFTLGGDVTWGMNKAEANAMIAELEAALPDMTPYLGKALTAYWQEQDV